MIKNEKWNIFIGAFYKKLLFVAFSSQAMINIYIYIYIYILYIYIIYIYIYIYIYILFSFEEKNNFIDSN